MLRLWWQYIKRHQKPIAVTVLILAVAIVLLSAGYSLSWTGFKGKTIWDWLNLLGVLAIPVVVGLGTAWLSSQQSQEDALQRYLDKMADFILDEKLGESKAQAEVRAVVRARTWTVLRLLDPGRRKIVFTFLVDSDLLSIVDLTRADFSGTNLRGVDLRGVNLSEANLQNSDLRGADLSGATLNFANMRGTRLGGANLNGLDFTASTVTKDQLLKARSLKGATMPDGSIHS